MWLADCSAWNYLQCKAERDEVLWDRCGPCAKGGQEFWAEEDFPEGVNFKVFPETGKLLFSVCILYVLETAGSIFFRFALNFRIVLIFVDLISLSANLHLLYFIANWKPLELLKTGVVIWAALDCYIPGIWKMDRRERLEAEGHPVHDKAYIVYIKIALVG